MGDDLRIVVLGKSTSLVHELTLACHGTGIEVLGPVETLDAVVMTQLSPPIVIVVSLENPSGVPLRDAIGALPGARVLAMSAAPDPATTAAVVSMGAAGVLERGGDRRTIVDALRRAAAGELVAPASHLPALLELSGHGRASDDRSSRMRTLTAREREVLALLAGGRTTGEIARALSISALTVQSHVKSILSKLGVHSKVEAIRFGWRSGALDVPIGA